MKERPILFSGPMVRALLAGSKTQTRRIVKPQPMTDCTVADYCDWEADYDASGIESVKFSPPFERSGAWQWWPEGEKEICCPYGRHGNRLWVKETLFPVHTVAHEPRFAAVTSRYLYRADYDYREKDRSIIGAHHWSPSIFCTRAASRITLEITSVRVERLNDISETDAIAEGIYNIGTKEAPAWKDYLWTIAGSQRGFAVPRTSYRTLWESINGEGSWDANPWVWVVEFKKV